MDMFFTDAMEIADRRIDTATGYLAVKARIARTGLYTYAGHEVGKPHLDRVVVYRPEGAVFDKRAMASFAHKPVTNEHPPEPVNAANWQQYSRGHSGGQVARDGEFLSVPLLVADAGLIADIEAGKVELSPGYTCKLEFVDGETPDGKPYQAVMSDIDCNHHAVVPRGRGGPECRIGDHYTPIPSGESRTMAENTKAVLVDGITIHTTDQGAQVIEKLQKQIADAAAAGDKLSGQIAALNDQHAKAIEAKDGEIAALKSQVLDGAALDARLAQREAVKTSARKLLGDSYDMAGKAEADIRRAAVSKRLGDAAVAGKSDDYVAAAFETLTHVADAAPLNDPLRFTGVTQVKVGDAASAYAESVTAMTNAWMGADQKGMN
jgi:hypothetical protein